VCRARHRWPAFKVSANPNEEQTLAVLRDPIPHRVQDRVADTIASLGQVGSCVISDIPASDREHPWDVLHHHRKRFPQRRCFQKTKVELVPRIGGMAFVGQAVELRSAYPGKALTRRAANQDVRFASGSETLQIELVFNVSLIAAEENRRSVGLETSEILRVGSGRGLIDIDGAENVAACGLKTQAEAPCATEEIDYAEPFGIARRH
jgi:hypothetical protein